MVIVSKKKKKREKRREMLSLDPLHISFILYSVPDSYLHPQWTSMELQRCK